MADCLFSAVNRIVGKSHFVLQVLHVNATAFLKCLDNPEFHFRLLYIVFPAEFNNVLGGYNS